jgi:hypothetical protein
LRELWINHQLVDLYPEEPIAVTKQVNQLNELKDRQADYSNRFKIPSTGNNLRITGFANRTSSNSINPYTKLHCRYVENGSEFIPNGVAIIDEYSGGDIELTAYSGNFDFFDAIGEGSIRLLNLSNADHTYDLAGVQSGFGNEYYCYPLIQWGATSKTNNIVDIRYQMPAIKLSYVIDKIVETAGFNKAGNVFNLLSYDALWIPVVEESLIDEQSVLDSYSMEAHLLNPVTPIVGGFDRIIPFSYFGSGSAFDSTAGWFDPVQRRWIAGHKVTVNVTVVVHMNTPYTLAPGATTEVARVYVKKNGSPTPVGEYIREEFFGSPIDPSTTAIIEIQNLTLNPGDYLQVFYRDPQFSDIIYPYDTGSPPNYSRFEVEAINTIELGQDIFMANLVPDISQKDLMKFFLNIYGLIPQIDYLTRTVNFVQFKEIAAKKELSVSLGQSYDWSSKLYFNEQNPKDPLNPKIRYRFESYAQRNFMRWIQDDDRAEVGDGIIYIDDQTLEDKKDLFTMPFAASIQEPGFKGHTGVNIKRWTLNEDLEYEITESVQPRIVLIRDYVSTGSPVEYLEYTDGVDTTEIIDNMKIAYFVDPLQPFDLNLENIIEQHYSELMSVLRKTKIANGFFDLTESDFKNLDFFKPVYVEHFGDFFYINVVPNFVNGRLASVELVRL